MGASATCKGATQTCAVGFPRSSSLWGTQMIQSHQASSQICCLSAATGKAFTMVLAGFAFTLISWPKAILFPALVAGFLRVLILQRLGIVKMPFFFTSVVARVAKLSRIPEHTLVLSSCCSASVFTRAPLVMTLLPDFIAFMAFMVFMGAMVVPM